MPFQLLRTAQTASRRVAIAPIARTFSESHTSPRRLQPEPMLTNPPSSPLPPRLQRQKLYPEITLQRHRRPALFRRQLDRLPNQRRPRDGFPHRQS